MSICVVCIYVCSHTGIIYHIHTILLLIISGGYVRDSTVCGIFITKQIIIDVHHWNSMVLHRLSYVHETVHSLVDMTHRWWMGSLLLVLCMVSIALLIVAAEAFTARLAGSD